MITSTCSGNSISSILPAMTWIRSVRWFFSTRLYKWIVRSANRTDDENDYFGVLSHGTRFYRVHLTCTGLNSKERKNTGTCTNIQDDLQWTKEMSVRRSASLNSLCRWNRLHCREWLVDRLKCVCNLASCSVAETNIRRTTAERACVDRHCDKADRYLEVLNSRWFFCSFIELTSALIVDIAARFDWREQLFETVDI